MTDRTLDHADPVHPDPNESEHIDPILSISLRASLKGILGTSAEAA